MAAVMVFGALFALSPLSAQDKPVEEKPEPAKEVGKEGQKPENEGEKGTVESTNPPEKDGHDRPTSYPQIRFGSKKGDEEDADGEEGDGPDVEKLKSRVYLLDVSDAMSKSLTVDDPLETTRLDHMIAQVDRSLKALSERGDPSLRFNIVTFGSVDDFAEGGELQAATPDTVKRARKWLSERRARGKSDIYGVLKECFEQEPDSATMIVGAVPSWPGGISEDDRKKYANAGEYVLAQVKEWRAEGKRTTLDITGVGLSADEAKYYKRLAEAAGGTYLDA